jgi:phage terminase large subunit-like protein
MSAAAVPKFSFCEDRARRAVNFIEKICMHTQGDYSGKPFVLEPWQKHEIVEPLFGMVREDGRRQYRTGYISVARKNGKSELGAALALYLTFADGEQGGQVFSAAADRAQASVVFDVAADMVQMSPILQRRATVVRSTKRIIDNQSRTVYRALSAEVATKHGLNASGVIFDELHTQPNRELWDVLKTSMGTRRQPLMLALTTAGWDRHSICYEMYSYGCDLRAGLKHDDSFFYFCREAPASADWTDPATWNLANPALGRFLNVDRMAEECEHAKQVPAFQNTFRNLYLNQWVQQQTRAIDLSAWDACCASDFPELAGEACFGGLDLSETNDITAFVMVFPRNGKFYVRPHFWLPKDDLRDRVRRDRVPYDVWAREGRITLCDGPVVDYQQVVADIGKLKDRFALKRIAFDRWGTLGVWQALKADGHEVAQFGQGFASMSSPTKELLSLIVTNRIHHDGNPVLRWMTDCLQVAQDPAGNIKPVKPDKRKNSQRIDGIVALVMALAQAMATEQQKPKPGMVLL